MANSRVKTVEAVITCFDYSDFLAETLPRNMCHFEHIVVVTSHEDLETQGLCKQLSVTCVVTDLHHFDDAQFAKGRAIGLGIAHLNSLDWIVHLDADIYLPPATRQWIDQSLPDPACIYGIDRCDCKSWDAWQKYINRHPKFLAQHRADCLVIPPPFPLSARISIREYGGYVPIGFFQLWHSKHGYRYPHHHGTAERTDVLHPLQWPLGKRLLMPEIIGIHLDTNRAAMGANWNGRKTAQFGPHDPFGIRRRKDCPQHEQYPKSYR